MVDTLVAIRDRGRGPTERTGQIDLCRRERRFLEAGNGDDRSDDFVADGQELVALVSLLDEMSLQPAEVVVEPARIAHPDAIAQLRKRHCIPLGRVPRPRFVERFGDIPERQQHGQPGLVAQQRKRLSRLRPGSTGQRFEGGTRSDPSLPWG